MSVLIKGMKMPTSCLKGGCPIDGSSCDLWEDKYWPSAEGPYKMRHKNCPIVELPEHRDLIDRDTLKYELGLLFDVIGARAYGFVLGTIDGVPTVIPAERKGEENV